MEKLLKIWCGFIFVISLIFALLTILAVGGGGMRGVGVDNDAFGRVTILFLGTAFAMPVISFCAMFWPRFAWALLPFLLGGCMIVFVMLPIGLLFLALFLITGVLAGMAWEEKREAINV